MEKLQYFGTDLRNHGHFFWELFDNSIVRSSIYFNDIPFNPEELTKQVPSIYERRKGTVEFYKIEGYTICRIEGSCVDDRSGTKSVFWLKENIAFADLWTRIIETPVAARMIEQMAFEVKDPRSKEYIESKCK